MIPWASQRGFGQDLATHLLNARDNERIELAEITGAIAPDLHGAFAEWEALAHALTRCEKYLYSLSINPDPAQGALSREQYFDYIERVEDKLGLTGQPRAVLFHSKYGREHCHVVWSRIDADNQKSVHIPFDREKLMMVTREFARDHGLELPDGYFNRREGKSKQLSLREMQQLAKTGLSKEDHMAQVTEAWRTSDSPRAFVQALAERGYILATGKRPYVLVDLYDGMYALPKMIDDKQVRSKDVQAFLGKAFPPDSLPTVEEAKEMAATHRKASEDFYKAQVMAEKIAALKAQQMQRRGRLFFRLDLMQAQQKRDRHTLNEKQKCDRAVLRSSYLAETRRIRAEREQRRKPKGLGAFFGRFSGVQYVIEKAHKLQDRKRYHAFAGEKSRLAEQQEEERKTQSARHRMQALELERQARTLDKIDKRELQSLKTELVKDHRVKARGGKARMPPLSLDPNGVLPSREEKELAAYERELAREEATFEGEEPGEPEKIDLTDEFSRAARDDGSDDGDGGGDDDGPSPDSGSKVRRYRRRRRDRDRGRGR